MSDYAKLEKRLDVLHSETIRRRDADEWGNIRCPICGVMDLPWRQMQCLHYNKRGHHSTKWDEKNAIGGCAICNQAEERDPIVRLKFTAVMKRRFGDENLRRLSTLNWQTAKYSRSELMEKIKYFKNRIKELKAAS